MMDGLRIFHAFLDQRKKALIAVRLIGLTEFFISVMPRVGLWLLAEDSNRES